MRARKKLNAAAASTRVILPRLVPEPCPADAEVAAASARLPAVVTDASTDLPRPRSNVYLLLN